MVIVGLVRRGFFVELEVDVIRAMLRLVMWRSDFGFVFFYRNFISAE